MRGRRNQDIRLFNQHPQENQDEHQAERVAVVHRFDENGENNEEQNRQDIMPGPRPGPGV